MKALLILFVSLIGSSFGLTTMQAINSPADCPNELKITARALPDRKNSFVFSIDFKVGDRSKRVVSARVEVRQDEQIVARMSASPRVKGNVSSFVVELSREAAQESTVNLSSHFCDDRGLIVIGGGKIFKINLAGFLPKDSKTVD